MKPATLLGPTVEGQSLRLYSSAAAAQLADLWSRISDLDLALGALERLQALRDIDTDLVLETSLYCTAAIYYRRCFSSGVRSRLHPSIDEELDADAEAIHALLLAVANKHIAHSVNSFEEVKVGVSLECPDAEPARFLGVAPVMSRLSSHNRDQLDKFLALIVNVREKLSARLEELGTAVANEVANIPVQDLLSLPSLEFRAVENDLADKRR